MDADTAPQILNDHEAARLLRLSVVALRRQARAGNIPAVQLPDGSLRFIRSELWNFLPTAAPLPEAPHHLRRPAVDGSSLEPLV